MTRTHFPPAPAWVDPPDPHKGLDLLGLRNPVQRIGNHCMDGVTSITPAIRYLGVYCWALRNYWQQGRPDADRAFKRYLGRVEFNLVLGNLIAEPSTLRLLGSDKAAGLLAQGGPFEPEALVKQTSAAVYGNVVEQLGLVRPGDGAIRHLTPIGLALADAAGAAFEGCPLGQTLAEAGPPDVVDRDALAAFGACAHIDRPSPDELAILGDLLVPPEPRGDPASRRARSYGLALHLCDALGQPPTVPAFLAWLASGAEVPGALADVRIGWRHFLTRDLIAVAHEVTLERVALAAESHGGSALAGALIGQVLGEGEASEVARAADGGAADAAQLLGHAMAKGATIATLDDRLAALTHARWETAGCVQWVAPLDEEHLIRVLHTEPVAGPMLLPLVWLLADHRWRPLVGSDALAVIDGAGVGRLGLTDVIAPTVARWLREGTTVRQAAAELAWRTVDQHLRIVWSRRRTLPGDRDAAVLVVDGDRWRARRAFSAGRTGSRLDEAFGWIATLGWWDASGLTAEGRRALSRALRAGEAS